MKFSPPIPSCSNENFYFHEGDYSFGFQAQEQDEEMWGGSVTYKYRVEDPRLGRFFSVDPLYAKYPWNSNYAFSENRLLDAIELEGLEAYYVHGTIKAWGKDYTGQVNGKQFGTDFLIDIGKSFGNASINQSFNWSGANNDAARHQAADELVNHILKTRKTGEPITLVGHSHGGNISIEAANILIEKHGIPASEINIVALNTPREDDISLKHFGVDLFVVSAKLDLVQGLGGDFGGGIEVKGGDKYLEYEDQIEEGEVEWNHYGIGEQNAKIWIPMLKNAISELKRPAVEPPLKQKIDIEEKRDNTDTKYDKK